MTFSFANRLRIAGLVAATMAAAASTAQATPFKFVTGNTSLSSTADISINGGGKYVNAYVGQYQIQLGGISMNTYCVDVANDIFSGDTTDATLLTPFASSFAKSTAQGGAAYLFGTTPAARLTNAKAVEYLIDKYLKSSTSLAKSVDTELAIWDIVNDGGDGVGMGNFKAKNINGGGTIADANALVTEAFGNTLALSDTVTWIKNPKLNNGEYQDFAIHGANFPVPEPAFYQMGAFLAGGGLMALRRKNRK